jgi:hypothetical protein
MMMIKLYVHLTAEQNNNMLLVHLSEGKGVFKGEYAMMCCWILLF